jgi:uncharacterized protein DUF1573
MSDEFGTMNVRGGDPTREIELLRKQFREHRDTLMRLARDVDAALARLDVLSGRSTAPMPDPALREKTEPGTRPLILPPEQAAAPPPGPPVASYEVPTAASTGSRLPLILIAGIIVLVLIGGLIWRASRQRRATGSITDTAPVTDTAAPATAAPGPVTTTTAAAAATPAATLSVQPASVDYGTIAKGSRAARQFELVNNGTQPITVNVARSQCHCLIYEYNGTLAPKKKETLTVTVDGAKAKGGTLRELITVSAKKNPSVSGQFQVSAVIR